MKRLAVALLYAAAAYAVAAVIAYGLVSARSANTHDRALEAAMTSLLVVAPAAAVLAFAIAIARAR